MSDERKTIFHVDDSASNLQMGKDLLSDMYNVYTFNSGAVMFKALAKKRPDIILLDVEMPDMSGHEVIAQLKNNKATANIPVIFLTAHDSIEAEVEGFSLGAVDYVTKPFSAPRLLKRIEAQMKLRELQGADQQRMKLMLDTLPMVCAVFDEQGTILDSNRASATMFGLTDRNIYIERFFELSPEIQPDGALSRQKIDEVMRQAFDTGRAHLEWMHQTPNGEPIPCEVHLERVPLGGKNVVIAYVRDLREQEEMRINMQMERDARQLKELFLDGSPYIVNIWDESITLVSTSRQAVEMFGLDSQQDYIKKFFDLSPEFQPDGNRSTTRALELMKQAFSQDGWMQFEWMHCTLEGEEVPVEVTLSRFKQNGRYFLAAYTVDLRPLREADEKIRKLEHAREMDERINLLFDAAPIAIGMYDENLKMFNCNKETLRLFGFGEKAEFISAYNTRLFDFFPFIQPSGADTAGLYTAAFKGAREEGSYRIEGPVIAADGEKIPADITLLYIRHGHSSMYVVYLRDLRQAKAAEERKRLAEIAEESSRAKSRFLARMSHEIRTPISAVAGISEIQLQNSSLPPDTEEAFAKIHDSSNVLLGIINDILDLSRIDSGKMSLTSAEYEVASLINDTMQPYLIQSGKDILLNVHVDENIPRILIGDALRIKQILNNVMSNAFKYTESGAVTLLLQYEKKQNPTLIISVRDTGLGMTPEQVDALFKEYVRFHEQETYAEGAGLGMAIVQSLIYLMGAEIDVQSEVGTGTNVTLRIPQETGGDEVIGKEMADRLQLFGGNADTDAKKFKFTPEPMPYGRVLVVDDIDTNLYVARGLLSFYDLSIETCESGQAAIEKVRKGNVYDIVFMDHMMPGLNGTQTMHVMRDMGYTAPIIALTANAIIGQAEEFMKNGFDDFISKPIQTATLNAVLIKYVRDKHPIAVVEAAKAAAATAPVRQTDIDKYQSSAELTNKLRTDFARRHKHTCMDINKALASGDTETAHIAAHSLKGSAGLIAENTLADAARDIENALRAGQRPTDEQMATLSAELGCVLARLGKPQPTIAPTNDLDKDKALALLDTLTPLLKSQNAKCLSYLDELKTMPETAILVRQIEEFDFRTATKSLETLRTIWDEW